MFSDSARVGWAKMASRNVVIRQFAHHGDLQHGHEFSAFEAEHCSAENLIGFGVDDGFHEATSFSPLQLREQPRTSAFLQCGLFCFARGLLIR